MTACVLCLSYSVRWHGMALSKLFAAFAMYHLCDVARDDM